MLTVPEVTAKFRTIEYVVFMIGGMGLADQKFVSPLDNIRGTAAPVISALFDPVRPIETVNPVTPANCTVSETRT